MYFWKSFFCTKLMLEVEATYSLSFKSLCWDIPTTPHFYCHFYMAKLTEKCFRPTYQFYFDNLVVFHLCWRHSTSFMTSLGLLVLPYNEIFIFSNYVEIRINRKNILKCHILCDGLESLRLQEWFSLDQKGSY